MSARTPASLIGLLILAGCQGFTAYGGPMSAEIDADNPVAILQNVNERALECWIASGDRNFRRLALVPELDTRTGDPRILVVRKGDAQGLPQLVISASGNPVELTTFGPLATERLSQRINSDILGWSTGRKTCR